MAELVLGFLTGLPKEWIVFLIAMIPFIELRGAIPVGIAIGVDPLATFLYALIGNMVPVPFILLLLNPLRRIASGWPVIGPFLRWAHARAEKRKAVVEKHGFWGLLTFVGIPLPGTGAWSGTLVAVILEMPVWRAALAITLGVLLAGVLIQLLSLIGLLAFRT